MASVGTRFGQNIWFQYWNSSFCDLKKHGLSKRPFSLKYLLSSTKLTFFLYSRAATKILSRPVHGLEKNNGVPRTRGVGEHVENLVLYLLQGPLVVCDVHHLIEKIKPILVCERRIAQGSNLKFSILPCSEPVSLLRHTVKTVHSCKLSQERELLYAGLGEHRRCGLYWLDPYRRRGVVVGRDAGLLRPATIVM